MKYVELTLYHNESKILIAVDKIISIYNYYESHKIGSRVEIKSFTPFLRKSIKTKVEVPEYADILVGTSVQLTSGGWLIAKESVNDIKNLLKGFE